MNTIISAKQIQLHSCAICLENITCAVLVWYSQHSIYVYFMMLRYLLKTKSVWNVLLYWASCVDERNTQCLSLYCRWEHVYLVYLHIELWTTHYKKTRESERAHSCFIEQLKLMWSSSLSCKNTSPLASVCSFLASWHDLTDLTLEFQPCNFFSVSQYVVVLR